MITKQEAHWPHCSPRKQFESINTFVQSYDYTIKLNHVGEKTISLENYMVPIWEYLNQFHPRMHFDKFIYYRYLTLIDSREEDFLIPSMHFCCFYYHLPLQKFLNVLMCFLPIISPWKKAWAFIWTNLNPFHPWILSSKFG